MGRMYAVSSTATTVTAAQLLASIDTHDDKVILIHRIALRVQTVTDEAIGFVVDRMSVVPTGGASVPTANPMDPGDAADSATCRNEPTGGTIGVEIGRWNTSTLAGLEVIYTPEERPVISAGLGISISSELTITSASIDWMILFEEIG